MKHYSADQFASDVRQLIDNIKAAQAELKDPRKELTVNFRLNGERVEVLDLDNAIIIAETDTNSVDVEDDSWEGYKYSYVKNLQAIRKFQTLIATGNWAIELSYDGDSICEAEGSLHTDEWGGAINEISEFIWRENEAHERLYERRED